MASYISTKEGFKEFQRLVIEDLRKVASHEVDKNLAYYFFRYLIANTSFKYTFWFRFGSYLKSAKGLVKVFYPMAYLFYKYYTYKYCNQIPLGANIAGGLSFQHFGTIVVNGGVSIGKNCTIYHGVTIGLKLGGHNEGVATIGDNCVLGPGCKILGKVTIGDNVFVGANAVVTHDVESGCVVGGIPAVVLNHNGVRATELVRIHK